MPSVEQTELDTARASILEQAGAVVGAVALCEPEGIGGAHRPSAWTVRREPVESLRVRVVPSVVIADRGGRIRYVHEGTLLGLNVREIEALLASR